MALFIRFPITASVQGVSNTSGIQTAMGLIYAKDVATAIPLKISVFL